MYSNREWFFTYESVYNKVLLIGNNVSCKVAKRGTIKIKIYDGMFRALTNVKHISELTKNLISMGVLDEKGYHFKVTNEVLKVGKGAVVMMKGRKYERNLYILEGSTIVGRIAIFSSTPLESNITKL